MPTASSIVDLLLSDQVVSWRRFIILLHWALTYNFSLLKPSLKVLASQSCNLPHPSLLVCVSSISLLLREFGKCHTSHCHHLLLRCCQRRYCCHAYTSIHHVMTMSDTNTLLTSLWRVNMQDLVLEMAGRDAQLLTGPGSTVSVTRTFKGSLLEVAFILS